MDQSLCKTIDCELFNTLNGFVAFNTVIFNVTF